MWMLYASYKVEAFSATILGSLSIDVATVICPSVFKAISFYRRGGGGCIGETFFLVLRKRKSCVCGIVVCTLSKRVREGGGGRE